MNSILDFGKKKSRRQKISMVTCYDYTMAKIVNETSIDAILVGDSGAMVLHGHNSTLSADVPMMCAMTQAVVRGAPGKFVIADLPFMSYRKSLSKNVSACEALMKAGAQALKLEGAEGNLSLIHHLTTSGIPVMGHLGLTPQSIHTLGGFKVQGREKSAAEKILNDARDLEKAGCFSIVLECIPATVAAEISRQLQIPVIGIGAGAETDGQVLVLQDLLGMNQGFSPVFLKKYLDGYELIKNALNDYQEEVCKGHFPSEQHSYKEVQI